MGASDGALLDGRVRYAQPASGFRSGIEPVLLAAAVPAQPGECVLEGGSGAGAGLLCLAARVPGIRGVGIECDPMLAALADGNARANDFAISFVAGDVLALPARGPFDHAFANPPYHDAAGTPSSDRLRADAKRAPAGLITGWAAALGADLRHGGTLSLILPPARLTEGLAGCARASCGGARILPLWPRAGQPAKLLLIRAVRGSRAPMTLLAGIALHDPEGGFTTEIEACLRGGVALRF
ncbi:MAG: methyltransferase domain-containing protein [Acetobacteraceae bacterium]